MVVVRAAVVPRTLVVVAMVRAVVVAVTGRDDTR